MYNTGTLILALREHKTEYGDEVQSRFTAMCLKPYDPSLLALQYWIQDSSGEKYIKPKLADGQDNPFWEGDPPREAEERAKWFLRIKRTIERDWEDRIRKGEFDEIQAVSRPSASSTASEPDEHVDVTRMDIEEDEPVEASEPEGVEIVKETLAEMPETEVVDDEELERKLESERIANLRVKFEEQQLEEGGIAKIDKEMKENIDKLAEPQEEEQDGDMLLTHLGLFVRKHIPETKNIDGLNLHQHMRMMDESIIKLQEEVGRLTKRCDAAASVIKAQQAAITDLSKQVPELIKQEMLKKFA